MKKRMKKRNYCKCILMVSLIVALQMLAPFKVDAASASSPGMACKSGRYIYYAYEDFGKKMSDESIRGGILRYDTKTKKKKQITSYMLNGERTHGFSSLSVKGNYIYAEWDQNWYGGDIPECYIYKINRKTGKKQKLARGKNPYISGKYIYYESVRIDKEGGTEGTGTICRMTLTGKNKEVVKTGTASGYGSKASVTSIKYKGYKYYVSKSGKTLYRKKLSSGKKSKLLSGKQIENIHICGKYIVVEVWTGDYSNHLSKHSAYCMKLNGKAKKKLATWGES